MRILGSLLGILLLFALTAALVKVDMSPGPFFSITMASVWFINCEHFCPHPSLLPVTERAYEMQEEKTAPLSPRSLMGKLKPRGRGKTHCPRPHSDLGAGLLAPSPTGQ